MIFFIEDLFEGRRLLFLWLYKPPFRTQSCDRSKASFYMLFAMMYLLARDESHRIVEREKYATDHDSLCQRPPHKSGNPS